MRGEIKADVFETETVLPSCHSDHMTWAKQVGSVCASSAIHPLKATRICGAPPAGEAAIGCHLGAILMRPRTIWMDAARPETGLSPNDVLWQHYHGASALVSASPHSRAGSNVLATL
jgi:hypothetical protein